MCGQLMECTVQLSSHTINLLLHFLGSGNMGKYSALWFCIVPPFGRANTATIELNIFPCTMVVNSDQSDCSIGGVFFSTSILHYHFIFYKYFILSLQPTNYVNWQMYGIIIKILSVHDHGTSWLHHSVSVSM